MSQKAAFDDANIPVLTEVVLDQASAAPAAPEPAPVTAVAVPEADGAAEVPEPDWSALEHRIAERALQQLQDPFGLVLDQALAGIADQIRAGLRQAIDAAVVQAVAEEVARLRTER